MSLGHALDMQAIQGGRAKNDRIDSHKIAAFLRGGMLAHASVSPAARRATRELLRRRTHLMRQRAELFSHVQNPKSQSNLPEMGKKIASKATRNGVAARFADPAVQKNLEVDLALITSYDDLIRDLQNFLATLENKHGKGKALSILAHKLARAVYDRLNGAPLILAFA